MTLTRIVNGTPRVVVPRVVYLAHPVGPRDDGRESRCLDALGAACELLRAGFVVICPALWPLALPHDDVLGYEEWMAFGLALVERADAVVRLPGESPGADREVAHATALGLPVFLGVDALIAAVEATRMPDWQGEAIAGLPLACLP